MKVFVVLSVLVAIAVAAPTNEMDLLLNYDFDGLLNDDELRPKAFACFSGKAECGDLQPINDAVVIVLKSKCGECNAEQQAKYDSVLKVLKEKHEDFYNEVQKKMGN